LRPLLRISFLGTHRRGARAHNKSPVKAGRVHMCPFPHCPRR
jgi:hypothetical protein